MPSFLNSSPADGHCHSDSQVTATRTFGGGRGRRIATSLGVLEMRDEAQDQHKVEGSIAYGLSLRG
jgi:hypothetical protein